MGYVIYLVGGFTSEEEKIHMSNQTEKYYIEDDEWDVLLPILN